MSLTTGQRQDAVHAVVFYGDDTELAAGVVAHLLPALEGGGTAVVASTAGHVALFAEHLAAAGIDWADAVATGRLLTLDADATASDLTAGGRLDHDRFSATVGALVERAASGPGPVRVFGEIVAVLWEAAGEVVALGLESLWNELLGNLDFDLLCAYPTTIRTEPLSLADLCAVHSAVSGTSPGPEWDPPNELARRSFDGRPADAAGARHFVNEVLGTHGPAGLAEAAALIVTELASNAVVHAGTAFIVTVMTRPGGVRIAVADGSRRPPVRRDVGLPQCGGRGLRLVAALSADWGTYLAADGSKLVWADLLG